MRLLEKLDLGFLKKVKKSKKVFLVLILGLIFSLSIGHIASGKTLEPGSEEDPLVSKSYVDYVIQKLESNINSRFNNLKSLDGDSGESKAKDEVIEKMAEKIIELTRTVNSLTAQIKEQEKYLKYEVVEVEAGQKIIFKESSEVILRSGKALAIAGKNGDGLADITTDSDKNNLVTDDVVPPNHLLLVSRDDGRGLKAITKLYVLVKGSYTIIDAEQEEVQQEEEQDLKQQDEQENEQESNQVNEQQNVQENIQENDQKDDQEDDQKDDNDVQPESGQN